MCQCLGLKDLGQFSLLYLNSLLLSHSNPAAHRKITQGAILIFSCYVSVLSALSCFSFHFLSCQLLFRSLEGERLMQTGGLWCNPGPRKVCRSKSMFRILRVSLGLDAPRTRLLACSPWRCHHTLINSDCILPDPAADSSHTPDDWQLTADPLIPFSPPRLVARSPRVHTFCTCMWDSSQFPQLSPPLF